MINKIIKKLLSHTMCICEVYRTLFVTIKCIVKLEMNITSSINELGCSKYFFIYGRVLNCLV